MVNLSPTVLIAVTSLIPFSPVIHSDFNQLLNMSLWYVFRISPHPASLRFHLLSFSPNTSLKYLFVVLSIKNCPVPFDNMLSLSSLVMLALLFEYKNHFCILPVPQISSAALS